MKRILLLLLVFFLFACVNSEKVIPKAFTPGMLALQLFSIDANKDTSLQTLHGSIIKIMAGSFNLSGMIRLEVKEAFTPAEIFAAGLTTETNGRLLKSAGMIYINASIKGEKVELIKPIKVSIPNQYYDNSMQIFKGIETDSGTVNWINPQPTDITPQSLRWQSGETLFQTKCASCHKIFVDGTGPALAGIENRGPWLDHKNIYAFTRNPGAFMAKDGYTQNLKTKFGSMMTRFPDLSDLDIDAILAYIKNEEKRPGAAEEEKYYYDSLSKIIYPVDSISNAGYLTADTNKDNSVFSTVKPCKEDTVYIPVPKSGQSFLEVEGVNVYQPPVIIDTNRKSGPIKAEDMEGLRGGFTDPNPTSGMYDFEIKTFGWYNIDAFVEGYVGATNVKVWAQLQIEFDITMHLYLFIPKNKMLSVSNRKDGNNYSFDKINGSVPLFLNDRAILFAFGSKGDEMYYGISEFVIQGEQTIQIKIKETTPDEIRNMLLAKQMEGIDLGIEKKEMIVINPPCNEGLLVPVDSTNK